MVDERWQTKLFQRWFDVDMFARFIWFSKFCWFPNHGLISGNYWVDKTLSGTVFQMPESLKYFNNSWEIVKQSHKFEK